MISVSGGPGGGWPKFRGLQIIENMVARDGIAWHYIGLPLHLDGILLDPKTARAA
jgi:hypothetical protein